MLAQQLDISGPRCFVVLVVFTAEGAGKDFVLADLEQDFSCPWPVRGPVPRGAWAANPRLAPTPAWTAWVISMTTPLSVHSQPGCCRRIYIALVSPVEYSLVNPHLHITTTISSSSQYSLSTGFTSVMSSTTGSAVWRGHPPCHPSYRHRNGAPPPPPEKVGQLCYMDI